MNIKASTLEYILNTNSTIANAVMIMQLTQEGLTAKEIAIKVGVTQQNVSKTQKKYSLLEESNDHKVIKG